MTSSTSDRAYEATMRGAVDNAVGPNKAADAAPLEKYDPETKGGAQPPARGIYPEVTQNGPPTSPTEVNWGRDSASYGAYSPVQAPYPYTHAHTHPHSHAPPPPEHQQRPQATGPVQQGAPAYANPQTYGGYASYGAQGQYHQPPPPGPPQEPHHSQPWLNQHVGSSFSSSVHTNPVPGGSTYQPPANSAGVVAAPRRGCEVLKSLKLVLHGISLDRMDGMRMPGLGMSDPYVVVELVLPDGSMKHLVRSETIKRNLNPCWEELSLSYHLQDGDPKDSSEKFKLSVFDEDLTNPDDLIGFTYATLAQLSAKPTLTITRPRKGRQPRTSGSLSVRSCSVGVFDKR